jgi:hydrogenase maturation protease
MTRVLIGGIGYRNLRDHSVGVVLTDALTLRSWSPDISIEDISYNPIAVVQRLQDDPPHRRFGLAIVAGATQRPGRSPGTLTIYRWDGRLPASGGIHDAITEAVTGVIALDNTVVVAGHFGVLPRTVVIIEIEPDAHEFGDTLTPAVAKALGRATTTAVELAFDPAKALSLPEGSLASRAHHTGIVFARVQHDREAH